MASIAVLSAVAFVLSFLEFPVPLSPSFARMDLSDFLKGLVITAFAMLVYKRIRPLLKGKD